jgi:large subunit ribosomal protein L1
MGKIRLKTLGEDDQEKQQAADAEKRREAKREAKKAKKVKTPEAETEKVEVKKAEKPTEKTEQAVEVVAEPTESTEVAAEKEPTSNRAKDKAKKEASKASKSKSTVKVAGKNYKAAQKKVDVKKQYGLQDAIKLVKDMTYAKFDETVEIHINLREEGLKGEVTLPHGTGKEVRVAIADDKLLGEIDGGVINFDVLITSPAFMPKLVKYARVLGPKGLMPNPKNGTVSENPEQAVKKFKSGNIHYKSEAKAPLLHQAVGKLSFKQDQLVENVEAFVKAVGMKNITSVYLTASMTPSVKLDLETL